MGLLRKIAGMLGIALEDDAPVAGAGGTRGRTQIPAPVERPVQGPVVVPCDLGDQGGVQGFRWYTRSLQIDDDGDVADEFLDEVVTTGVELPAPADQTTFPKFQVTCKTRPSALSMKKQIFAANGNILHSLEYQGRMILA